MNPKQISQDDLILYALQDMTPAEAAEVLVHLEHSESARAELAEIRSDLAAYAMTSELHSPPALARERLLRQVMKERKFTPVERSAPASASVEEPLLMPRRVIGIDEASVKRPKIGAWGWAGWAVAACCAAAAGLEYERHQSLQEDLYSQNVKLEQVTADAARAQDVMKMLTDGGAMQVSLHVTPTGTPEPPKPEGHAAYIAQNGQLVFIGLHLAPLETYKTYELWVIPADGHDPVPAGLFKPDARGFASVIMPDLPKGVVAKTLAVTVEDDGGSKLPTTTPVLLGM